MSGVPLDELAGRLAANPESDLVVAVCNDLYRANYPRSYIAAHHPLLVLKINGKPPSGWPEDSEAHRYDLGPYLISHPKFTPSFKILAHADEPQIPWGVVRIEFRDEQQVFGAIEPHGPRANDATVQAGFKIARQNCFRCHNAGDEGGRKSGVTWTVLSAMAADSPASLQRLRAKSEVEESRRENAGQSAIRREDFACLDHLFSDHVAFGAAMSVRIAKIALVFGVAIFYTFVVFNNMTDYGSNYQFVRHVLMMDSTFPGNHGMWRAAEPACPAHRILSCRLSPGRR